MLEARLDLIPPVENHGQVDGRTLADLEGRRGHIREYCQRFGQCIGMLMVFLSFALGVDASDEEFAP
jgi:hypothetical protein